MRIALKSWMALMLGAATSALAAGSHDVWHFTLAADAQVSAGRVRLGDVATVSGGSDTRTRALAALELAATPGFGDTLKLSRSGLSDWLRRAAPDLPAVIWEGADAVSISRAGQDVPAATVCNAAAQAMQVALSDGPVRAVIEAQCPALPWRVPQGQLDIRPRAVSRSDWPARRVSVPVELWVDGQFARTVSVPVHVQLMGLAWVARADVSAQQPLTEAPLDQVELDLAGLVSAPVPAESRLEGMRLRRPLRKGEVLTSAHAESLPAVLRGHQVRVHARLGAISLESTAEALQDGVPGKAVLVRMGDRTALPINAVVTGPNQVQLQP